MPTNRHDEKHLKSLLIREFSEEDAQNKFRNFIYRLFYGAIFKYPEMVGSLQFKKINLYDHLANIGVNGLQIKIQIKNIIKSLF